MTKAVQIVERAYRLLGIKAEDETLTADQVQSGLDALNAMLAAWFMAGLLKDEPAVMQAESDFVLSPGYEDLTAHLLGARLAPSFMVPLTFDPDPHRRLLERASLSYPVITIDPALLPIRWVL